MSALAQTVTGELAEESLFFAPMSADLVDSLVGQYDSARKRIEALATTVRVDNIGTVVPNEIQRVIKSSTSGA